MYKHRQIDKYHTTAKKIVESWLLLHRYDMSTAALGLL